MSRFNYPFLVCLCILPVIGHSADNLQKSYLISKDKLKCLYEQTDSLLKEPMEPVIVILNNHCDQPRAQLSNGEKSRLPLFNPQVDPKAPTLKPEDVLMLSRAQLKCFKQAFDELMKQAQEPVSVRFTDTCNMDGDVKS